MQEQGPVPPTDVLAARWGVRGASDGPLAFRAVVRATVEGSATNSRAPGSKCAALILGRLGSGDASAIVPILGTLIETANHDEWFEASYRTSSFDFMGAYRDAFIGGFLEAGAVFAGDDRTIEDVLAEGSATDELRWRGALVAVERLPPAGVTMPRSDRGHGQPSFVVYQYVVSLGLVSFKRSSGVKMIPAGGSRFLPGLPYTLVSLMAGWWGIPWGPLWTIETILRNLGGGIDVSDAVMAGASRA